jgi:hypothetical protein
MSTWVQQCKILFFSLSLTSTSVNYIASANYYYRGRPKRATNAPWRGSSSARAVDLGKVRPGNRHRVLSRCLEWSFVGSQLIKLTEVGSTKTHGE